MRAFASILSLIALNLSGGSSAATHTAPVWLANAVREFETICSDGGPSAAAREVESSRLPDRIRYGHSSGLTLHYYEVDGGRTMYLTRISSQDPANEFRSACRLAVPIGDRPNPLDAQLLQLVGGEDDQRHDITSGAIAGDYVILEVSHFAADGGTHARSERH